MIIQVNCHRLLIYIYKEKFSCSSKLILYSTCVGRYLGVNLSTVYNFPTSPNLKPNTCLSQCCTADDCWEFQRTKTWLTSIQFDARGFSMPLEISPHFHFHPRKSVKVLESFWKSYGALVSSQTETQCSGQ